MESALMLFGSTGSSAVGLPIKQLSEIIAPRFVDFCFL